NEQARGDDQTERNDDSPKNLRFEDSCQRSTDPTSDEARGRHDGDNRPYNWAEQGKGHDGDGIDQHREQRLETIQPLEVVHDEQCEQREKNHAETGTEVRAVGASKCDSDPQLARPSLEARSWPFAHAPS